MSQTALLTHKSQVDGQDEAKELGSQGVHGKENTVSISATGEKQLLLAQTAWRTKDPLHCLEESGTSQDDVPDIRSKRDLTVLCEVEDAETGAFLRCTYGYIDHSDSAWFGRMPGIRKYDLTIEDLKRTLRRIPDEQIYPEVTPSITVMQSCEDDDNSHYIKRPHLTGCDDAGVAALLPGLLIGEAEVLEFLKKQPHPNLIKYYGCTLKDKFVTGIVLQKHDCLLLYRYEDRPLPLNTAACMDGIKAGVRHLHSLGLAHNDLNPMNILLDKDDNPVIVDFGSCRKFGEQLISAGTPGWIDEEYIISTGENDEAALQKIKSWLAAREKEFDQEHGNKACGKRPLNMTAGLL